MNYVAADARYDKMKYNKCGESGLKLPGVSLGFWHNFGDTANFENMRNMCFTAFDNGITHFDFANNYGPEYGAAERNGGRILHDYFKNYRDELIISTKAGFDMWKGPYGVGGSRKYMLASLDQSLKRLQLDYVDIYYHHVPDGSTPLEETMGALATAVTSGKALYVGISNYNGERMAECAKILDEMKVPYVINQNSYNIFNRDIERNGLKEESRRLKKGIITFSPLAQGLLTNRYMNGIPQDSRIVSDGRFLGSGSINELYLKKVRALNALAEERGQTLAEMSLAWILRDDVVTSVLIGASKPSQILDNIKALENTKFSEEELNKIDEICAMQ